MVRTRICQMLAIALICGVLAAGCVPVERPIRPRPTVGPMVTRVPAPVPRPTVSPLDVASASDLAITTVIAPGWGLRAVSAPDAPVALAGPESEVVNVVCVGDCIVHGGPSWVTSDARVAWTHPDPLSVDEYQVWRSRHEPYFEPASCSVCERVATTTALSVVVSDSPPGFNPVGGTETAALWSEIDFYRLQACNAGGCSGLSNEIGVFSYSLLQGFSPAVLLP